MVVHNQKASILPPVILLGGEAVALSVARSLGSRGIKVYAHDYPGSYVRYSRFSEWLPLKHNSDLKKVWLDWLTGEGIKPFSGAVVLPCCDEGLELIARHRAQLKNDYILIEANDDVLLSMLDKAKTHEIAQQCGIPTPKVWIVNSRENILEVMDAVTYPCALKPRVSHEFAKYFPEKLFVIQNNDEMVRVFDKVHQFKLDMMITEIVAGGEERFCSYYSYLDENGKPLFHFTKRKLRQFPNGFGLGTYHVTDWNSEVAELGFRFFQKVGLRGIGHVEFKRDAQNNVLKVIECNPRFVLVNELLKISGIDLAWIVYNRLIGKPLPPIKEYRRGVYALRPFSDYLAFRVANRRGELSWKQWLRSLMHRQHFLYFKFRDPMPSIVRIYPFVCGLIKKSLLFNNKAVQKGINS